jgi:hypothetical protein
LPFPHAERVALQLVGEQICARRVSFAFAFASSPLTKREGDLRSEEPLSELDDDGGDALVRPLGRVLAGVVR